MRILGFSKKWDKLFTEYEKSDPYQEVDWDIILMKALLAKADPIIRAEAYKEIGEWLEKKRSVYLHLGLAHYTLHIDGVEALKQGKRPE